MFPTRLPLVSVVLICEQPQQVTGSGCCGKLKGDPVLTGTDEAFREVRQRREAMGLLYRTARRLFAAEFERGLVTVVEVDPRNQLYLVPKLWRDVFRYRPGWRTGLRTMCQFFSLPAVIVNGRVVSRAGAEMTPDELCHLISALLHQPLAAE